MKLRKSESSVESSTAASGGATIAARFQLDVDGQASKKNTATVGKTSTLIALLAAIGALALVAFSAWMMYSDWTIASTT
jgi:uncharacterized membrane protein YebE (DUF533 family)